jgi:glutamyl-tRNA reductase
LSADERARLEQFSLSLLTRLLHEPTLRLRESGSARHAEAVRELFGLEGRDAEVVELRAVS